jgi:hypothetical protein
MGWIRWVSGVSFSNAMAFGSNPSTSMPTSSPKTRSSSRTRRTSTSAEVSTREPD